jgi:hypothetical protein
VTAKQSEKGRKTEEKTNKRTEKNRVKRMYMPRRTTNKRVQNDPETPR